MQKHRVFRVERPRGQVLRELSSAWHVIADAVVLVGLMTSGLIRLSPNSLQTNLTTFFVFYAWVETWYYMAHRGMHRSRWLYRFHREHHLSRVVTPLSSMSMSWVERAFLYTGGWLAFMSIMSWLIPISLPGLVAYYSYHFVISLHGHSNTEASSLGPIMTKAGMGSATSHAMHHARPDANFGFSNMIWDRVLRTYDPQTSELQLKALQGSGATQLRRAHSTELAKYQAG
jgi:sterol desaturase/sphingolipid hydroxylase (fatty acid hydroxylase superfamily)